MLLVFLVDRIAADSAMCQDYLYYDNKTKKCCAVSDSANDIWLCPIDQMCKMGKKCGKRSDVGAEIAAIAYTIWFVIFTIQAITIMYLIWKLDNPHHDKSLNFAIFFQAMLNFGIITFIVVIILSVKVNDLFYILCIMVAFGCGMIIVLYTAGLWRDMLDGKEHLDIIYLNSAFEKAANTFHGDNDLGKYWRSTVVNEEIMPRRRLFNFKINLSSNHKRYKEQKNFIVGIGYFQYTIFFPIRTFLKKSLFGNIIEIIIYSLGLAAPLLYFEVVIEDMHETYIINIYQEVTDEENDPLYPYKVGKKGSYKFEEFFNIDFDFNETNIKLKRSDYVRPNKSILESGKKLNRELLGRSKKREDSDSSEISLSNEDPVSI